MHLGNGQITPMCAVYGFAAASGGIGLSMMVLRRSGRPKAGDFVLATTAMFLAQMVNVPLFAGVSGHLIGTVLLAYWFGPLWSILGVSMILTAQALLLGDGGSWALGANIFNMALIPNLIVYPLIREKLRSESRSLRMLALAGGAWLSVVLAAAACALELTSLTGATVQWLALAGTLLGVHSAIGLLEGFISVAIVAWLEYAVALPRPARVVVPGLALATLLAICSFSAQARPDGLEFALQHQGLVEPGR
jgi:cobalt/nickel transport system permease protein